MTNCDCQTNIVTTLEKVRLIAEQQKNQPGSLIPVLHAAQKLMDNHLSEDALKIIAAGLSIPLAKVYGVATFYSMFSIKPRGQHVIRMCESAPCHIKGANEVINAFQKELGIKVGETTSDGKFTLEFSACLGICGVAPAVMVNDDMYGNLTPEKVQEVISRYQA